MDTLTTKIARLEEEIQRACIGCAMMASYFDVPFEAMSFLYHRETCPSHALYKELQQLRWVQEGRPNACITGAKDFWRVETSHTHAFPHNQDRPGIEIRAVRAVP